LAPFIPTWPLVKLGKAKKTNKQPNQFFKPKRKMECRKRKKKQVKKAKWRRVPDDFYVVVSCVTVIFSLWNSFSFSNFGAFFSTLEKWSSHFAELRNWGFCLEKGWAAPVVNCWMPAV
jgi:hypothetical protein